jgi:hypothetical protein
MTPGNNIYIDVRLLLALSLSLMMAAVDSFGQRKPSHAELMKRASVIFMGTVSKMEAVSTDGVAPSGNTAIVTVDRIIEKPKALSLAEGKQVTVELKDPTVFHEGTRATFYTEGWVLGKGVAVKEIGHELLTTAAVRRVPTDEEQQASKARQEKKDTDLRARIASADMIAVGRVMSIHPLAVAAPGGKPVTEHNPDWQEATIRVESGLKGITAGKEIVVHFPASRDVAYYGAPKFTVNQEGVFFLKKDTITGKPQALLRGIQVNAYLVHEQQDVLPKEDAARVRNAMKTH